MMAILFLLATVPAAVIDEGFGSGDGHSVEWLLGELGRHVDVFDQQNEGGGWLLQLSGWFEDDDSDSSS